jgi:hypothetical protein
MNSLLLALSVLATSALLVPGDAEAQRPAGAAAPASVADTAATSEARGWSVRRSAGSQQDASRAARQWPIRRRQGRLLWCSRLGNRRPGDRKRHRRGGRFHLSGVPDTDVINGRRILCDHGPDLRPVQCGPGGNRVLLPHAGRTGTWHRGGG